MRVGYMFMCCDVIEFSLVLSSACESAIGSTSLSRALRALLDMHNALNDLGGRSKVWWGDGTLGNAVTSLGAGGGLQAGFSRASERS
jgi:hypothetical protein